MKITRVRTEIAHIPFTPPIGSGAGELRSSDCVLVFLETDQGLVGEGLVFSLNNRHVAVILAMVRNLEPLVLGLDPTLGGSVSLRARREIAAIGHAGVSIVGLAGIDNALWDLRAKAAGMNVSRLIGACSTTVPVYNSCGLWLSRSIDELQREADAFVKKGFRAMKLRLGKPDPREDIERVRRVRETIGPNIRLMTDANQRLTVPEAIRLGRMLEEFNLTWFEEPVFALDHAGEAAVAAALDTPICSGESEYTSRGMLAMLRHHSADILMPDLQRMGGPTELLKAANLADAFDMPVASHLFPEMNHALLAAMPNAYYLEYIPWFEDLYRERITLDADGNAIVPDAPGWGYSLDPESIRQHKPS